MCYFNNIDRNITKYKYESYNMFVDVPEVTHKLFPPQNNVPSCTQMNVNDEKLNIASKRTLFYRILIIISETNTNNNITFEHKILKKKII